MKKSLIALSLAAAFAAPAFAQTAAPAAEAAASPHTLTGNVGLFSSYRFRGIDQTAGKPALQGGFDYSHASGIYVGNWNSNVSSGAGFPEGIWIWISTVATKWRSVISGLMWAVSITTTRVPMLPRSLAAMPRMSAEPPAAP